MVVSPGIVKGVIEMFKVGDVVMIKPGLTTLRYGFGTVELKDIGTITDIASFISVDFPTHGGFAADPDEIILAKDSKEKEKELKNKEEQEQKLIKQNTTEEERDLTKKLIETVKKSELKDSRSRPELWYKGTGHGGYRSFTVGWFKGSSCYSPVCIDTCNILIKANKTINFTKGQQKFITSLLKGVSTHVKEYMKEKPIDWEDNSAWFGCGRAYANYFAFVLWRLLMQKPETVHILQYFRKLGYNTAESYFLLCHFRDSLYLPNLNIIGDYSTEGLVKRLARCGSYKRKLPYTMGYTLLKRDKLEKKYITKKIFMEEELYKFKLDAILAEEG